ncbi:PREDICTED: pentatricopeptide repeat-containing protein At5g46460, mitochondrial [Tarenaya hassleriana]|uniref:pentatricopeptide repeat-containing protein At5g46460, mitochondrial n=1 Tax=Tarenaya hassleriana TaxID=28532 RepID=UPI00053C4840|nr:PREDICTED: pentatricopeptide repeat-containing protein At5g46460, mitochondrial [Tarenaya hassleriana]
MTSRAISRRLSVLRLSSQVFRVQSHKTFSASVDSTHSCRKALILHHLRDNRIDEAREILSRDPSPDVNLCTMMISAYARSNRLVDALKVFDQMPMRDVVSWNSMINGCVECGALDTAMTLFDEMPERTVVSWTTMVNGCFRSGRVAEAERLFHQMPRRDTAAWNAMIHGYLQFGKVDDAFKLFTLIPCPNVVSWTSMIGGLDQNGNSGGALVLFRKMMDSRVKPTSRTFACVITACANAPSFHLGVQVHGFIVKLGFFFEEYVSASLITFYANCKRVEDSRKVLDEKVHVNVAVWTALLSGYSLNRKHEDALSVFSVMLKADILPNQSTFTSTLNSCTALEALDRGKEIHGVAIKLGLGSDVFVGNSLVVMYSECGNMHDAASAFTGVSGKNIVSWNSAIVGYAQHGNGRWALEIFCRMVRLNVEPDEITFTGLLSACSHCGYLEKGRKLFEYMSRRNPVDIKLQHYTCMVDILGRSGKLKEAEEFIESMPVKPNEMVWLALLGACRMHSDIDRAERAAEAILELEANTSAVYVLLSNIYASARRWSDVSRMRGKMRQSGIRKRPGKSWVVMKGEKHEFCTGDRTHPMTDKIHEKIEFLRRKLREMGYEPDKRYALHDVEEEQKEEMLWNHSERLAIAFGLVSSRVEGSTITVMKNLRVCGDCHSVTKLISIVVGREIVVRDTTRFHHFKDGVCSCGDYW